MNLLPREIQRPALLEELSEQLFEERRDVIWSRTDRLFACLMVLQWIAGLIAAWVISPGTWAGAENTAQSLVGQALLLGGVLAAFPVAFAILRPGRAITRYVIAATQMLSSALLIHLTGGRIETHFHIFGSLAFLAFYRDWRVFIPATIVVALDHGVRGVFWPQSVFGVFAASPWRSVEHVAWVVLEDTFLIGFCIQAVRDMRDAAQKRAQLELQKGELEAQVSEREQTERALRESERQVRFVTDNVNDVIWVLDTGFRFTYVSPSIERSRGFTPKEAMKAGFGFGLTPASFAYVTREIADRLTAEREGRYDPISDEPIEVEAYCKDGSTVWLEMSVSINRDEEGKPLGIMGVSRDITARKQAEEESARLEDRFREAQKMEAVGTLAGGLAHDFNNLLGGILGYSSMLRTGQNDPAQIAKAADMIEKSAEKMGELTRQLLGFARRGKLQIKPIELSELIRDVVNLLDRTMGKKIEIVGKFSAERLSVMGDPSQLEQVILNLALNAREAMPDGGLLSFETDWVEIEPGDCYASADVRPGKFAELTVSDTGAGIPVEIRERIFEPFFTTKAMGKGSGMGLAMVYGIVQNHGGFIRVYSEPGEGSVFRICLPLAEVRETASDDAPAYQPPIQGSGRILVVDDEEIIRETVTDMLTSLGYEVVTANDGREAVDYYRDHQDEIDLAIIDYIMPRMNGSECFDSMKAMNPKIKAILSSGYSRDGIPQAVLDAGMLDFTQKPFRIRDLSEAVAKALE